MGLLSRWALPPRGVDSAWRSVNGVASSKLHQTDNVEMLAHKLVFNSATGTRTRVARVRAEYPSQLDYSGLGGVVERCWQKI